MTMLITLSDESLLQFGFDFQTGSCLKMLTTTSVLHIVLVEIIYKCHAKFILADKIQNYNNSMMFLRKNLSD